MAELKRETVIYRVESETEAETLIKEFKENQAKGNYEVTKYQSVYKNKKEKGEIVDEWYLVTIQKDYEVA